MRAKNLLPTLALRGLPPSKNGTLPNFKGFRIFTKGKPKPTQKKERSEAAPLGKKIRCKILLRAAHRPQKTALCQISKAFAFLQKEKPKPTPKGAQLCCAPRQKNSLQNLAARGLPPPKRHFAKLQRILHFCKRENPSQQKKGAQPPFLSCAPCFFDKMHYFFSKTALTTRKTRNLFPCPIQHCGPPPQRKTQLDKKGRSFAAPHNKINLHLKLSPATRE